MNLQTRSRTLRSIAAAVLMASVGSTAPALADDDADRPQPRTVGKTLLNRQNGGPRTGLIGVKSQPARPIKQLGGVKAKLPRPLGNRGSLLPPNDPKKSSPLRRPHASGGSRPERNHEGRGPDRGDFSGRGNPDADGARIGFDSRSGFRAAGQFSDDDFRLRFRLFPGGVGNSYHPKYRGDRHGGRGHHHHHGHGYRPPYYYYPWSYSNLFGYGWDDYYRGYDYYPPQTLYSSPVFVDASMLGAQAPQPPAPPVPLTTLEQADGALYEGRFAEALTAYREHMQRTPEDADAMRRMAIALILEKQVKEGVALMSLAYEKDISLVRRPLSMDILPESERRFRDMLYQVVPFANSMRTSSGYLTVAVLMQAEGRKPVALKQIRKAKDLGLDARLLVEFETELGR